jgi:hypothetical protein
MPTLPDNSAKASDVLTSGPASSYRGRTTTARPGKVFLTVGTPPPKPPRFPWVVFWRDGNMPQQSSRSPWPPQCPPNYGGQTGDSVWSIARNGWLCIATTCTDYQAYANLVFFNWGMAPCGQSKITGWREPDGTHFVSDQSNL